jgi:predicted neuraminidase
MGKTTIICLITAMCLAMATAILTLNDQNVSAQSMSQPYNTTGACENNTSLPSNYFTVTCNNMLIKTNDTITNLNCDTSEGWIVVCAWEQQSNQTNGTSQNTISVSTSLDGGNSYNSSKLNFANSTSSAQNPQVGVALDFAYVSYELEVTPGNHDIFLAASADGGQNFDTPINISNSTTNSVAAKMIVDKLTGKVVLPYIEEGDDSVKVYCTRC